MNSVWSDYIYILKKSWPEADEYFLKVAAGLCEDSFLTVSDVLAIRDITKGCDHYRINIQFLLLIMFLTLNRGSICLDISHDAICKCLSGFISDLDNIENITSKIMKFFDSKKDFDEKNSFIISECLCDKNKITSPLILHKSAEGYRQIFFERFYSYKLRLEENIRKRVCGPVNLPEDFMAMKNIFYRILPDFMRDNIEQQMAVLLSILSRWLVISGGPGTGKTSCVSSVLRFHMSMGVNPENIFLVAPTGRAAKRMEESLKNGIAANFYNEIESGVFDIKPATIHRTLKYSVSANRFLYNSHNKLPARLVVVDEASMIDLALMVCLLEAIPDDANIIICGDSQQLPSVDAGGIFANLAAEQQGNSFSETVIKLADEFGIEISDKMVAKSPTFFTDRFVYLKESNRSEGLIKELSKSSDEDHFKEILQRAEIFKYTSLDQPVHGKYDINFNLGVGENLKHIIPPENKEERILFDKRVTDLWLWENYGNDKSFLENISVVSNNGSDFLTQESGQVVLDDILGHVGKYQILTIVKHGFYGCDGINSRAIELLGNRSRHGYYSGLPIMIIRNNYVLGLFNGDTGVLVEAADGVLRAAFKINGKMELFTLETIGDEWVPAYAVTIHKSQGSEYDDVFIQIPPDDYKSAWPLMIREILYTGITRARKNAVINADNAALNRIITNTVTRETGICFS